MPGIQSETTCLVVRDDKRTYYFMINNIYLLSYLFQDSSDISFMIITSMRKAYIYIYI